MERRILFVDDEEKVLEGLRRMLRSMRHEWKTAFASSGQGALEILRSEPFDVVVTDMRMPGMDGSQLLTQVMKDHPHIVRIVLSGQSDKNMILKSVRQAHQYLSKPCDPEVLKSTVTRACALRSLLMDDSLKQLISQIESLPSLPTLYAELIEALKSPDTSAQKVGEIISRDMAMTAKILQIVNSTFFGLLRHVSNPAQAVSLLGIEIVKALVLSVKIFSQFDEVTVRGFPIDVLWDHSMVSGVYAKAIAKKEGLGRDDIDGAFMAGVLHDLGKLVLLANLPRQYGEVVAMAKRENRLVLEVEREVLGATHAEVGAYLIGLWGLPNSVVEAIAFHHNPRMCLDSRFGPLTAVHVGDALEHERKVATVGEVQARLDLAYLSALNMTDRLAVWREACKNSIKRRDEDG